MNDNTPQSAHEIPGRFQVIVSQMIVGIAQTDLEGRFVLVNERLCEITGYSREELLEMSVGDITHHDDWPENKALFERAVREGIPYVIEKRYIRKDGEIVWVENSVSTIRDANGSLHSLLAVTIDITKSMLAQESLKTSEERYRAFVTQSSEAIWRFELRNPIPIDLPLEKQIEQFYEYAYLAECNDATARMYGYSTAAEIIDSSLMDFAPRHERNVEFLRTFIRSGYYLAEAESHEFDRDGNSKYFLNNLFGVVEHGLLKRTWGTQRDITDQKKSIAAVNESKTTLSLSMKSSRMGAWVRDIATGKISWTEELEEIFGLEKGSFRGTNEHFYGLVHKDDLATLRNAVSDSLAEHRDYVVEFRFHHADGSIRWMEGRGQGLYSPITGNAITLYGIGMDVTDRKLAEEAVLKAERRASEDYLALLSRIVPLAEAMGTARNLKYIYRVLLDFVRVSMPCTAFFVSFYQAEENLRTAAFAWGEEGEVDISTLPPMLLTPDGGPNSQAVFQKRSIVVNNYMDVMRTRPHLILQDNGIEPRSSLVVPMIVMNRIIGTLEVQSYIAGDFTREHIVALEMAGNLAAAAIENVRLWQVEAEARESAEAANRAKDEFLSVLSHELRTPLNSMLGWIRMIRTDSLDGPQTKQAIEIIERNTLLQHNLIEDLLDVSRIISGKLRIEPEIVDYVPLIAEAVETVRPLAQNKNVFFDFRTGIASVKVEGDRTRLQQVAINLMNNAIKFTPAEGTVVVRLFVEDGFVNLEVLDTGVGIKPGFLEHIFERFAQADSTTKRVHSGLGLGLTIVKYLSELHGGWVRAFSDGEDQGAKFVVGIPVIPDTEEPFSADEATDVPAAGDHSFAGVKILIVDDDCEGLTPIKILLERLSADVICAGSARAGLDLLKNEHFDLLISDIGMPEMDGYELIKDVRQLPDYRDLPAIAVTAYASTEDRHRTLEAGFQQHLSKPVDFEQLLATIKTMLNDGKN